MPVPPQDNHQESLEPDPQMPSPHPSCSGDYERDVDADGYQGDMDEHLRQQSPHADVNTEFFGRGDQLYRNYHTSLNGRPCDVNGVYLPPGAPPPPPENLATDDWTPFRNRTEFEMAEFLYKHNQMPAGQIDRLLDLWASTLAKHNDNPPFADHRDLYHVIDSSPFGDVPWQCFTDEDKPWMDDEYEVWFRDPCEVARNMLANSTYANEIDYCPYREYSTEGNKRQWKDFMSGDWVWDQADKITKDPSTLGSTFVPVILGSDKTTVSVGTGNNEYYPLYASIGNIHNNVRRAHCDGVVIIGFLAMPKSIFHRQLFHLSLSKILDLLKPGMMTPEATRFRDGHYWRVIYGLGPYIVDYKEQVLLACIVRNWCPKCVANREDLDEDALPCSREFTEALVEEADSGDLWEDFGIVAQLVPFTNDFPRADIYQMISPDILHQLIKGAFKDHLMTWVEKYLRQTHNKQKAQKIMDDIDRRIAAVASFSGLRRFPQGRGFKQWTGDDSKALMKVYLPAIEGHVPQDVIRAFRALLDFCYLVHCNIITEDSLLQIEDALSRFHHYRKIFRTTDVVLHFSLPRQHSLMHYAQNIRLFAAPNGLCSSITENKRIKAILLTNQRLDKLSALQVDFTRQGMLTGTCLSAANALEGKARTQTVPALADELHIPHLPNLLRRFLFQQLHPDDPRDPSDVPLAECPLYLSKIAVFNSASLRFYAPSDLSGIGGMHTEHIHSCPSWRGGHSRNDCVFVNTDSNLPGMQGLEVACVRAFFSFQYRGEVYPCAVVHWFDKISNAADEDTGMWVVRPGEGANNTAEHAIIHIDAIYRAAHLIPMYGMEFLPQELKFYHSYDAFRTYYVNKYADHHAFEIAF
ncbi:hypothetical protein DFJ58DRAFT_716906 [Suillus subalutaceus]|uniref:uncharacterized protein n=1 Tax=Suillus subalutaceus TaxID=48586 RepID=UPI001B86FFAE|nr:uncharacterized protein DFJ58DRAFT_716906 [Suillus subalutaceus]KAG1849689.1 hypothetical protein DFJ58DRAFT_716906 [Suillus subalutaceus]